MVESDSGHQRHQDAHRQAAEQDGPHHGFLIIIPAYSGSLLCSIAVQLQAFRQMLYIWAELDTEVCGGVE